MNRYFRCEGCDNRCVICINNDICPVPTTCPWNKSNETWKEVKNYELIKREPDYAAMAERKQFGKFWDDGDIIYEYLWEYDDTEVYTFRSRGSSSWFKHFTPMTEPVELDLE